MPDIRIGWIALTTTKNSNVQCCTICRPNEALSCHSDSQKINNQVKRLYIMRLTSNVAKRVSASNRSTSRRVIIKASVQKHHGYQFSGNTIYDQE
jgi:hypothetical protein